MTAREDLLDVIHFTECANRGTSPEAMIQAAIDEAIQAHDNVLHFTGRPAPGEAGYARDQLIVAFRGGEEGEFCQYGWEEAAAMADRVIRSLREELRKETAALACDCGELSCPCGCQAGEQPKHWIHSRTCNTQKRRP